MAFRGDRRPRAVWRRDGLQRVRRDGAKGERQPVSLRAQAGRLGRDRLRRDAARDAVQLSTTEEPSHRLRLVDSLHDRSRFAVFGFSSINGAHRWIKLPGVSLQPIGDFKTRADHFSCVLPREARG